MLDSLGALRQVETGGTSNPYGNVTRDTNGINSYGAYQIQEPNIGPWSQAALGYTLTPQQFLTNPAAQDQIAAYQFGLYQNQFGSPEAAAAAWNGGPNAGAFYAANGYANNATAGYVNNFSNALGNNYVPVSSGGGLTISVPADQVAATGQGGTSATPSIQGSGCLPLGATMGGGAGAGAGIGFLIGGGPIGAAVGGLAGAAAGYGLNCNSAGSGWGALISQYFLRIVIIVLGFIFVFAGLMMFKGESPIELVTSKLQKG